MPSSSPCAPAAGWSVTASRPLTPASARSSASQTSSSAPCASAVGHERMQLGEAGQPRDLLVDHRVVLHRARAERVEGRRRAVVPLRQAQEVAQHLELADLGQAVEVVLAPQLGGQSRTARRAAGSRPAGAARRTRARRSAARRAARALRLPALAARRAAERVHEPVDLLAAMRLGDAEQERIRQLGIPAAERVARRPRRRAARAPPSAPRRPARATTNSLKNGAAKRRRTPAASSRCAASCAAR